MFEKSEIKSFFKENSIVTVTFTKKNGDERVMHCTTHLSEINEDDHPVGSERPQNDEVMKVYDLEKQAWRSFRFDSIIDIK